MTMVIPVTGTALAASVGVSRIHDTPPLHVFIWLVDLKLLANHPVPRYIPAFGARV